MPSIESALQKSGWTLTDCTILKIGDFVATCNGRPTETQGYITDITKRNGAVFIFYAGRSVATLIPGRGSMWVAPREYGHLEQLWGVNGDMYVNVSHAPHEPYFVPAVFVKPEHYKHIAPQAPDQLLKEKP